MEVIAIVSFSLDSFRLGQMVRKWTSSPVASLQRAHSLSFNGFFGDL